MARRVPQPRFANARSVRNAWERARLREANRLVSDGKLVTRDDLMRIEADDIYRSRWSIQAPEEQLLDGGTVPGVRR